LEFFEGAVTRKNIVSIASVVVVKGLGDDVGNSYGFESCELKLAFGSACKIGFVREKFDNLGSIFGMEINRP